MESSGNHRSGLLTAGGILSIIGGTFEVIGGGALVALVVSPAVQHALLYPLILGIYPPVWPVMPTWLICVGVSLLVLGVIAIVGGVSAARRKRFGLSLAGAICALPSGILGWYLAVIALTVVTEVGVFLLAAMAICGLALVILGILAVVFVLVSKKEFGGEGKEKGTASRGELLTAGGVLSIMDGALEVVGGGIMMGLAIAHRDMFGLVGHGVWGGTPFIRSSLFGDVSLIWLINVGVPLLVLGVVGIAGGVWAIRRRVFGLSLAGAICALPSVIFAVPLGWAIGVGINAALTSLILGILAIVFVALGKREFRGEGPSGV
jgi:hypothetical protein